jgi:hypothetical protein
MLYLTEITLDWGKDIRAVGRTGAPERGGVAPGVKATVTGGTGLVAMPNEMLANGGTPV